jgi:Tfp pilus assembly protein PilF
MAASRTRRGGIVVGLVGVLALGLSACSGGGGSSDSPAQSLDTALNTGLHDQLQGNLSAAKSEYDEVLKADPNNVYAHYNLGLIAQNQQQKATAESQYRSALQSNPNFEPALFNLGIVLTQASPTEAIAEYERAITVDPKDANAHFNLGLLLSQTGQKSAGDIQVNEAIKLNPALAQRVPNAASGNPAAPSGAPSASTSTTG